MKKTLLTLLASLMTAMSAYAWKPLFAGHRGSYRGVENTAQAYRNGADYYGYTGLECDVRVTKDKQYVICHEETTANFSSTNLTIASSTLAQLKALTFKQTRGGVTYYGEICTVAEYLDICNEKNCFPIIELKWTTGINSNDMSNFPGLWELVKSKGLENKAIFLTSMQNSLLYIKTNYPQAHCQYLMYTDSDSRFAFCQKYGIDASIGESGVTQAVVNRYRNVGLNVAVWSVNSEYNYKVYGNYGCYMMTCDYLMPSSMPELTTNQPTIPDYLLQQPPVEDTFDYSYPETYNLRQRYTDYPIPELAGKTIRRVVTYYNYLYILALDQWNNPTIILYHPDTRKVLTNISTTGMDGTQLKCSDIQVTSDGVLLACNKELTQCDDDHIDASDQRRGTLRIYRWAKNQWDIPEGDPYTWLYSQYTGDWYRSYAGDTFAYSGSSTDGKAVFSCETTGSSRGVRLMTIPVSGGVMGAESYHIPYYNGAAANFSVATFGDGYRFVTSPTDADNFIVIGPGDTPALECGFYHTNKAEVLNVMRTEGLANTSAYGSTIAWGDRKLLAVPTVSGGYVSGVEVTELTHGINRAAKSTLTGNAVASAWSQSYYVGGRQLWKNNSSTGAYGYALDIFLLRDNKITYFTTAPDTTDPVPVFTEKWNLSDTRGTTTAMGWDATQVRNMDFWKGKLYMVYQQNDIKVVNATTALELGNLNKGGVGGGTVKLADVRAIDGKIVASNIALTANDDPLRLYRWDNDQVNPTVILDTKDFGGAHRVGDYIGWSGTWEAGAFYFCSDDGTSTRLLRYAVSGGVVSPTPTVTYLTLDGTTQLKTSISPRIHPESDGFWIDGRENELTFVGLDGVKRFNVNQDRPWGNAFKTFKYEGSTFALTTVYDTSDVIKGRMRLSCADKGWTQTYDIADYPYDGLSQTRTNGNATSGIATYVHDNTIEAWVLITNQGIAHYVNREGTKAEFATEPIVPIKPVVISSRPSANISAKSGVRGALPISFSGTDLTADITLQITGNDAGCFSLSADRISADAAAMTIEVGFCCDTPGSYSATLVAVSEGSDPVNVALTAQVSDPRQTVEDIRILQPVWSHTDNEGTLAEAGWMTASDHPVRDFCTANYNLYLTCCAEWDNSPRVEVVSAYGGVGYRTLNMEGVTGGLLPAASIREMGGHLIMSNAARAAGIDSSSETDPLKVYFWDNDQSAPRLWLEDSTHGGIQAGEIMSVEGNLTRGNIIFSDGSTVLIYGVELGRVAPTPKIVTLTREGTPYSVGHRRGSVSVAMMADGTMWVTGSDCYPTRFTASGEYIEELTSANVAGEPNGTSSELFTLGQRNYMVTSTYLNLTNTWNPTTEGSLAIIDLTEGAASSVTTAIAPAEGLGASPNPSYQSRVVMEKSTDGERFNFWIMVPGQGIAYYKYDAANLRAALPQGDVNADGNVDISDITALINEMLAPSGLASADANYDGTVDVGDITAVVNALLSR